MQAYAQDHGDVVTNMVGLAAALIGDRMYYWVDPLGAILLAAYIIVNWSQTALENIRAMVGMSRLRNFWYGPCLAWNHHPDIVLMTPSGRTRSVRNGFVEVDVVLDEDMPLRRAHDIGEELQNGIEQMEEVEAPWCTSISRANTRPSTD